MTSSSNDQANIGDENLTNGLNQIALQINLLMVRIKPLCKSI